MSTKKQTLSSKNLMRYFFIILIILIVAFSVEISLNHLLSQKQNNDQTEIEFKQTNWSKIDPITFLNILKKHPENPYTIANPAPQDWIKEKHIKKLILLINSKIPASPVVSVISSYYPFNQTSTIGNEAMFLIEGFKTGHYPPSLCSTYYFKGNPDEYKKWWKEWKVNK